MNSCGKDNNQRGRIAAAAAATGPRVRVSRQLAKCIAQRAALYCFKSHTRKRRVKYETLLWRFSLFSLLFRRRENSSLSLSLWPRPSFYESIMKIKRIAHTTKTKQKQRPSAFLYSLCSKKFTITAPEQKRVITDL
jgi:hypothetical protein